MHVHWTDERYIVPKWERGALPVLTIPAAMQKNATEEAIPLLPGFERILLETPADDREGWAFNPISLQLKVGRKARRERPTIAWVGRVIGKIGEKAGVCSRRRAIHPPDSPVRTICGGAVSTGWLPPACQSGTWRPSCGTPALRRLAGTTRRGTCRGWLVRFVNDLNSCRQFTKPRS
jgi:hypothetical protein